MEVLFKTIGGKITLSATISEIDKDDAIWMFIALGKQLKVFERMGKDSRAELDKAVIAARQENKDE